MPPQQEDTYKDPLLSPSSSVNQPTTASDKRTDIDYNTMDQLDPHEPVKRPSVYRRKSFLMEFVESKGPPQILLIMLLLALGFGSTIGVVPAVMTDRYARLNHGYSDPTDCADWASMEDKPHECLAGSGDAQNGAAYENLVSNVLTFITSSLIGSISDEKGRRGIIIIGLSLSCVSPLFLVLVQLSPSMSPSWYYMAGTLTGLVNWIAVALSALADVLPTEWRAAGFGLLLASFSLGFALSPILASFFNHLQVSVASLCVLMIAWLVTVFFLPETLPAATAAEAARVRAEQPYNPTRWGRTKHAITRPFREISILNRNSFFRLLSALAFFSGMVATADRTLLIYYVEERLAFNDHDVAIMFMLIGILGILVQGVLIKPFNECFGERWVIVIAFLLGAVDNFMYGAAKNKSTIYVATVISSFGGMSFPTISAIKANNVEESEQGRIQGALYSLQALAAGVGPMLLRGVYHYTKDTDFPGPGAMFTFAGFLYIVAAGFAFALPKDKANSARRHSQVDYEPPADVEEPTDKEGPIDRPLI